MSGLISPAGCPSTQWMAPIYSSEESAHYPDLFPPPHSRPTSQQALCSLILPLFALHPSTNSLAHHCSPVTVLVLSSFRPPSKQSWKSAARERFLKDKILMMYLAPLYDFSGFTQLFWIRLDSALKALYKMTITYSSALTVHLCIGTNPSLM